MFEHEKLDVYLLGRELNREIARITGICLKGGGDHIDQVIRAGASITRNIAEGAGEWSPKEKAKFFRYGKRSATEAAASLDVLVDYRMISDEQIASAKQLLLRIIPMLLRLIQKFELETSTRTRTKTRTSSKTLSAATESGRRARTTTTGP
jgi:four helix bundle protein